MQKLSDIFLFPAEQPAAWTVETYYPLDHVSVFQRIGFSPDPAHEERFYLHVETQSFAGRIGLGADPLENPLMTMFGEGIHVPIKTEADVLEQFLKKSFANSEKAFSQYLEIQFRYKSIIDNLTPGSLEQVAELAARSLLISVAQEKYNPSWIRI